MPLKLMILPHESRQRRKLAELAKAQGKSVAEVSRQALDAGLEPLSHMEHRDRMLAALQAARVLRDSMSMFDINVVTDLQQLREEQNDGLFRSN